MQVQITALRSWYSCRYFICSCGRRFIWAWFSAQSFNLCPNRGGAFHRPVNPFVGRNFFLRRMLSYGKRAVHSKKYKLPAYRDFWHAAYRSGSPFLFAFQSRRCFHPFYCRYCFFLCVYDCFLYPLSKMPCRLACLILPVIPLAPLVHLAFTGPPRGDKAAFFKTVKKSGCALPHPLFKGCHYSFFTGFSVFPARVRSACCISFLSASFATASISLMRFSWLTRGAPGS